MADYDDQVKRLQAWERKHGDRTWKIMNRPVQNEHRVWVVKKLPDGPVREFQDLRAMLDVVEGVMPEDPRMPTNVPLTT